MLQSEKAVFKENETNFFKTKDKLWFESSRQRGRGQKNYKCEFCDGSFARAGSLKMHIQLEHVDQMLTEPKALECDICKKEFTDHKKLDLHKSTLHTIAEFYCESCDTHFKSQSAFSLHENRFHPEKVDASKSFRCSLCPKIFSTKFHLTNHIAAIHETEKEFQCNHCDKSFGNQFLLKNHCRNRHYEGKPKFECSDCDRKFKTRR